MLLPQPDGPINAVILLRGMSIVMSLRARLDPYQTERPRVESTTGSSCAGRRLGRRGAAAGGFAAARSAAAFRRRSSMGSHVRKDAASGTFVNDNA